MECLIIIIILYHRLNGNRPFQPVNITRGGSHVSKSKDDQTGTSRHDSTLSNKQCTRGGLPSQSLKMTQLEPADMTQLYDCNTFS